MAVGQKTVESSHARRGARRVVFLAYDGVELLDVAGPSNVLSAATRLVAPAAGYALELAARERGPVATSGFQLVAERALRDLRGEIDTLVVPGGFSAQLEGAHLVAPIRRLAPRCRRVAAVCSGAFLLADAGLLRGRRAVSHWAACAMLRERHPDLQVEEDAIFIRDGKVWTSAGVTAGMDLALALVEQDLGSAVALEVARWLVMYLRRPGGQSQFSAPLAAQRAERSALSAALQWAADNLRADLSVRALARRVGMSERNFARLFVAEVGVTPAAWVRKLRIEAARRALETSRNPVKQIALRCGFASAEALHHAFQRSLRTTPLAYRSRFRSDM